MEKDGRSIRSRDERLIEETENILSGDLEKCLCQKNVLPKAYRWPCVLCWGVGWHYRSWLFDWIRGGVTSGEIIVCTQLSRHTEEKGVCSICGNDGWVFRFFVPITIITTIALREGFIPNNYRLQLLARQYENLYKLRQRGGL